MHLLFGAMADWPASLSHSEPMMMIQPRGRQVVAVS
jgi:hypothetical protein